MFTITTKPVGGYTFTVLLVARLSLLGIALYGLIQLFGAWTWLIVLLSFEITVSGKRFAVFSPEINKWYTTLTLWTGLGYAIWLLLAR